MFQNKCHCLFFWLPKCQFNNITYFLPILSQSRTLSPCISEYTFISFVYGQSDKHTLKLS